MARWKPGARARLVRSALELFQEQGFAETTVPQIAARAGVTNRTFFRYFGDKREVVFGNEADLAVELRTALALAPDELGATDFLAWVVRQLATQRVTGPREELRMLREIIASDDGLRERSLAKWHATHRLLADSLRERGLASTRAQLLAETAVAAFQLAIGEWLEAGESARLDEFALAALSTLRADLGAVLDAAAESSSAR